MFLILVTACSQVTSPEDTITGEYQSQDPAMILWLKQAGNEAKATLMWDGFIFELEGTYKHSTRQLRLSGNLFGYQNLSLDLWYSDKLLSGGYNYNGQGTVKLSLRWTEGL